MACIIQKIENSCCYSLRLRWIGFTNRQPNSISYNENAVHTFCGVLTWSIQR